MADLNAFELQTQSLPSSLDSSWIREARTFLVGALFALCVAAVGGALVTVALTALVVAAPALPVAIAWAIVRERRQERSRAVAALRPVTS